MTASEIIRPRSDEQLQQYAERIAEAARDIDRLSNAELPADSPDYDAELIATKLRQAWGAR